MPTLDKRAQKPRWKGVATVNGTRFEKRFPDNTQKSYRAAVQWEDATRQELKSPGTRTVTGSPSCLEWLNAYLDFCKDTKSPKTFEEKLLTAKRFLQDVGKNTLVENLDAPMVMGFLRTEHKKRSGYSANRVRKNLAAGWKWASKFLAGFPRKTPNPFTEVDRFPEVRQPRYVPPESDFWRVFDEASGQDRVLLLTFLHLAARKGEVFRLRVDDLDFDNQTALISTRKREGGNTEFDRVPLTDTLAAALKAWIELRPVQSEFVFINLGEEKFCREFYGQPFVNRQHFLGKLCEKAGVRPFSYHAIRHLSASILYREGQPVSVLQAILRHKSPTTTARYLHGLSLPQAREALNSVLHGRRRREASMSV